MDQQPDLDSAALHDAIKTNSNSKFSPFSLTLSNGATLTGIFYLPPSSALSNQSSKPLVVGIHGATCSAYNWDVSPDYTASIFSDLFGLPFVAFNRPSYLDSSGWIIDRASTPSQPSRFKAPAEGEGYFAEEGRWFHEYIFPALWTHFAVPNGCSAIITTSHSMSVPGTVIAGGLYSTKLDDDNHKQSYNWAGMVITGFGVEATETRSKSSAALATDAVRDAKDLSPGQDATIHTTPFTISDKRDLMLGPEGLGDAELRPLISKQTAPFLIAEIMDMVAVWPQKAAEYQAAVKIPILYGLGSHDWIWRANRRTVNEFLQGFTASERVEGAVVDGAGHTIELSPVSTGWWIRCFGWAIEVTQGQTVRQKKIPVFD